MLLALTTEGGSREDGNVYHTEFVLVSVPVEVEPQVSSYLDGRLQAEDLYFTAGEDGDADALFDDPAALAADLTAAGFPAQKIEAHIVVSANE